MSKYEISHKYFRKLAVTEQERPGNSYSLRSVHKLFCRTCEL